MQSKTFLEQPLTNAPSAFNQFWEDVKASAQPYWYPVEPGESIFRRDSRMGDARSPNLINNVLSSTRHQLSINDEASLPYHLLRFLLQNQNNDIL